ncbi:histidine kinase dimerization/phosphoacceptor domain -containing protein [Niastella yeongjuensis]|uniref:histidine kinase dimerization/phosphoacceptor domain -containing protein n=1 Tax=Niastella yeongjuensis TaxID=354355 RepID=UPI0013FD898A|nr:histidine kinase dimerization/phosphoacceptor domain -containing protein [Niastella yeongjuensis]
MFILLVPGSPFCMAQKWQTQTDSLLQAFKKATTPVQKVKLLTDAATIFLLQNPDTALLLSSEAEAIAESNGNDTSRALAYAAKSAAYLIKDNDAMILEYALKGLQLSEHTPLPPDVLAALTRKLGFVYRNTNRFNESVEAYKKALAYSTRSHNLYDMATTSSNIGNIFNSFNKYDSGLIYHNKTIEIARKANFKDIIVRSYMQIINSYNGLKQYPKAFQAVSDMQPYLNDPDVTQVTKGLVYTVIASLDMRHGSPQHPLAARYLDSMKHLITHTGPGKENLINYYLNRSLLEFSLNHFDSASAALEKYNELKKTRDDEIISGHAQELATRYETGKKEAQIKDLDQQNRLRKKLLFGSFTASAIFLALLFWVWLQNKRIKKQETHLNYLMKELHHRVKNNLQIVSSLLNLQSARIDDAQARKALMEGQHRIEAMSLIHQKLYQTKTTSRVNIQEFIAELSENLLHAYGYKAHNFNLQLQVEVKELEADMAIPVGLILNEVVTNAFKYAYKNVSDPALYISLQEQPNKLQLTIGDNGRELTEKAWKYSTSFGRQLILSLTQQLEGTMQLNCDSGSVFTFTFPVKPVQA